MFKLTCWASSTTSLVEGLPENWTVPVASRKMPASTTSAPKNLLTPQVCGVFNWEEIARMGHQCPINATRVRWPGPDSHHEDEKEMCAKLIIQNPNYFVKPNYQNGSSLSWGFDHPRDAGLKGLSRRALPRRRGATSTFVEWAVRRPELGIKNELETLPGTALQQSGVQQLDDKIADA